MQFLKKDKSIEKNGKNHEQGFIIKQTLIANRHTNLTIIRKMNIKTTM